MDDMEIFTNEIYEMPIAMSTHGLVTANENGVQTAESFMEHITLFDVELTKRDVPRPVVLLSDSHSSRKDTRVLELCKQLQIRLFFEPADTSGFLQALDQINKQCHERYKKEKNRFKRSRTLNHGTDSLNTADFLSILARMWPHWSCPSDRVRSFERVGITQQIINTADIDRSKFVIEKPAPPPPPLNITPESPVGVRKNSAEYWQGKFKSALGIIKELTDTEVGPKAAGVLEVQVVQRKKNLSQRRITEGHGSVSMQNLLEKRKAQEQERENEEAAKKRRVDEREEKKAADVKAKEELVAKFKACLPCCTCAPAAPTEPPADESPETNDENTSDVSHSKGGRKRKRPNKDMPQPMFEKPAPLPVAAPPPPPPPPYQCPMAAYHLCPHCGDLKKVKCRKAECKAKEES